MESTRVLVVDENPTIYQELSEQLPVDEMVFMQVNKSSEALRILQQKSMGLLILDVGCCSMPIEEIVPIIHGIDRNLPIIVTAEHNTTELEKQIRAQKIFYYHIKSFGSADLVLAVKNALEKRSDKRPENKEA